VKSGAKANKKKPQIVTGNVTWSANTGCGSTAVNVGQSGNRDLYDHGPTGRSDVITATYSGDSNQRRKQRYAEPEPAGQWVADDESP